MKTNWLLILLFPVLLLTAGCQHDGDTFGPRVRGTGPTVTETRALNSFSRVELKINADVILTQGSRQEVRIEAQRNIMDVLETELNGDQLEIEFGNVNVRSHDPIKIYVTVPSLSEVKVSGSGKLRSASPWSASSLRVEVTGSGDAELNVTQVNSLYTRVSGSGEARLSGDATSHTVNISGSGAVRAYDLDTQDAYVSISGSGKAYVRAARTLDADISGSGTVYYRGNPTVTSRISGSGRVLTGN